VHDDIIVIAAEREEHVTSYSTCDESFVRTINTCSTSVHVAAKFSTEP